LISYSDKALDRAKALSEQPKRTDSPKVHIETLGCRVNQYESQACKEVFEAFGYECVDYTNWVDCYFINTCSVTLESDRKSRNMIRRMIGEAKMKNAAAIVCGCHVQANPDEEFDYENIYLCGNSNKAEFVKRVLEHNAPKRDVPKRSEMKCFFDTPTTSSKNTRAFIKIEDGCDNFCSYCIVPYLRGPVRSRDPESILREARILAEKGYTELVLTGIETSYFGKDLEGGWDLASLAERISLTDGIKRIRFGSLRPTLFTEDFCRRLSAIDKIADHFHLSVQSGSNSVLTMMRRNYSHEDLLAVFENIKRYFPASNLSADIICGFPGETQRDLKDSADIISKGRFLHTHIFPYSERPGTSAAKSAFQLPVSVRKQRASELLEHADKIAREVLFSHKDQYHEVLVEKISANACFGYTSNFIHTRFPARDGIKKGQTVRVKLGEQTLARSNSLTVKAELWDRTENEK